MGGWWVADIYHQSPPMLVAWVFWIIASIVLHELAHGWSAIKLGDRTPIETGHMTWNPLVHMGPVSLIMFALVGIAWGAMPVNPGRLRGRYGDAIVSAAGPAMNLALFVGCTIVAGVLRSAIGSNPPEFMNNFLIFFSIGSMLNLALMLFNLLPVPPLDGWRIAASFIPRLNSFFTSEKGAVVALILFAVIFMRAGNILFGFAMQASGWSIRTIDSIL